MRQKAQEFRAILDCIVFEVRLNKGWETVYVLHAFKRGDLSCILGTHIKMLGMVAHACDSKLGWEHQNSWDPLVSQSELVNQ